MKSIAAFLLLSFVVIAAPVKAEDERRYFIFANVTDNLRTNQMDIVERSDEGKQTLRALCKSKGRFWIWPETGPRICQQVEDEPSMDTLLLTFSPRLKERPLGTRLVATQPFPVQQWSLRAPTAAEQGVAERLSRLKPRDRALLKTPGNVQVLTVPQNHLEFLILPFRHGVVEREDGKYETLRYKIFMKDGARWRALYETEDKAPMFFGDIDDDGVPEIKSTPDCDGDCEFYQTFYPKTEVLVEWNVHG